MIGAIGLSLVMQKTISKDCLCPNRFLGLKGKLAWQQLLTQMTA